jgi:CheY-like chemotaxis protein
MSKTIVIVDDDPDDRELLEDAAKTLFMDNPIQTFNEAEAALQYLKDTNVQPLFILCDVNMPKMGGIEFREAIYRDEALLLKCIPFLFLSTSSDVFLIKEAYKLAVQGFFMKPNSYAEVVKMFSEISLYWTRCLHPNSKIFT